MTKLPAFAPNGMCPKHSLYPRECVVCAVTEKQTIQATFRLRVKTLFAEGTVADVR